MHIAYEENFGIFFSSPPFYDLPLPPQNSLVLLSFLLQLPEHTVPYLLKTVSRCISPTFLLWHKYIFMWWLSIHAAPQSTSRRVILQMWNAPVETARQYNLCTCLQYLIHPLHYHFSLDTPGILMDTCFTLPCHCYNVEMLFFFTGYILRM